MLGAILIFGINYAKLSIQEIIEGGDLGKR
jgi:hypothetical protein